MTSLNPNPKNDLASQLRQLGLKAAAESVDDSPPLKMAILSRSMVLRGGYGAFYAPDAGTITHSFRAQGYPWTIPQTFIANTDRQYRRLMKLIQEEPTLATAAAKAGMDEKTARKYRDLEKLPSQTKRQRTWRTRKDAFEEAWPEILEILERDEAVEAKTVFEYLSRQHPDRYQEGEIRTLQRRIKIWRARHGLAKEVMFVQEHQPGRQGQSDFTYMNSVGIMIAGQMFNHLAYHFTLTYSNWESVMVCFSESFESLSAGLQKSLWEVGAVPEEHRTDSLSAAVNNLKDEDEFTERYQGLIRHYGMRASHNNPGRGHENGDVEQAHHRFKRAVEQEMIRVRVFRD